MSGMSDMSDKSDGGGNYAQVIRVGDSPKTLLPRDTRFVLPTAPFRDR